MIKEFFKYTLLNILGMIGFSCYILADTYFIANGVGADGLAALNIAIPAYSFLNGCGLMLAMGGATKYSVFKNQGADNDANAVFTQTLVITAVFSAVFFMTGLFFSEPLARLLGANEEIFDMTYTYLKVILLFSPAFMLNNMFVCFVRNDGQPGLAMFAMLIASLSNIVFDYIFVYPLDMGILGAVLATGFSPIISSCILSLHIIKRRNGFHIVRRWFNCRLALFTMSLGLPSLVTEVSSGLVILVFNIIILGLAGNTGVAAYGVVANISLVVISVFTGLSQGVQPLMSAAHGREDRGTARRLLIYSIVFAMSISAVISAVVFMFADGITTLFNNENNAVLQSMAVEGLILYFTAIPFAAFNIIAAVFFTSVERPVPAHVISILRGLVIIIPVAFIMAKLWGITGVWLTFPITEAVVAVIAAVVCIRK